MRWGGFVKQRQVRFDIIGQGCGSRFGVRIQGKENEGKRYFLIFFYRFYNEIVQTTSIFFIFYFDFINLDKKCVFNSAGILSRLKPRLTYVSI
jgi:hypothetical protein